MKIMFNTLHATLKDMLLSSVITQIMYTDSPACRTLYEDFIHTLED